MDDNENDDYEVPTYARVLFGLISFPRILLNPVFGILKPLEKVLLDDLAKRLDPKSSEILKSQLDEINFVQEVTANTSEINFYKFKLSGADRSRSIPFLCEGEEVVLAEMIFSTENKKPITAKFFIVNKNFFSIDFSGDIRTIRKKTAINVLEFKQTWFEGE